jgi:hypothetical protein
VRFKTIFFLKLFLFLNGGTIDDANDAVDSDNHDDTGDNFDDVGDES